MKKVTIIGNNNNGLPAYDGCRVKIRLFEKIFKREGFACEIIELQGWKFRFLRIVRQIKKALSNSDTVILMSGSGGARLLVPLLAKLKRRSSSNARICYCPIGIGTISQLLLKNRLSRAEEEEFLSCKNFFGLQDKKMGESLKEFDSIVLENKTLIDVYAQFYGLGNLRLLTNFRDSLPLGRKPFSLDGDMKAIYLARINESKGAIDLAECVNRYNSSSSVKIRLDFYGNLEFDTAEQKDLFESLLNELVTYKGTVNPDRAIETISNYDLYCFPVKAHEGTPGSLIESLFAGTPAIASRLTQINEFIADMESGFVYEFGSKEALYEKLCFIMENRKLLPAMSQKVQERSYRFSYQGNRERFLSYFFLF